MRKNNCISRLLTIMMVTILSANLTSCVTNSYVAKYSVDLTSVESPTDAKVQFGETKVASFNDNDISKYRYEDDYIDIVWYVSKTEFNFTLRNKSNYTIKINWDDISYVDINGNTGRIMHAGIKYSERNSSQPSSTIPKNASLSDIILPTDNVYYETYIGWKEKPLIPSVYETKEAFARKADTYVGKTMKVLMPIIIENVQNDYTFEFSISSLLNPEIGK